MRAISIAVAGAGVMGRRHIELIQANNSCRLKAIVDLTPASVQIARNAGVSWYPSLGEMFAKESLDGVIIATPNQFHLENGRDCISAGVVTLIEKPIAHTVEEGLGLCEAAEKAGARILIGHHRSHSPIVAKAREVILQGVLGEIVAVMGSAMFYKPAEYFEVAPWHREPGGGPILTNLIHEIGNLRSLCGEIVAVQALASNARRRYPVEDTVAINLRFANGALGVFILSDTAASARSWEQTTQEDKRYPSYSDEDCYVIAGTDGSLAIPTMRLKTFARKQGRSWYQPYQASLVSCERSDPLERQLEHFCAVIRGERAPLVTCRDGLQNLRIAEAIAEAVRTGHVIDTQQQPIKSSNERLGA